MITSAVRQRRGLLIAAASLIVVMDAIWLWHKTRPAEPFFVYETTFDGMSTSLNSDGKPLEVAALPYYKNGRWTFRGEPLVNLRRFIRDRHNIIDSNQFVIEYRLDPNATWEDYANSTRDIWELGNIGALAYIPEAYASVNSKAGGLEISEYHPYARTEN